MKTLSNQIVGSAALALVVAAQVVAGESRSPCVPRRCLPPWICASVFTMFTMCGRLSTAHRDDDDDDGTNTTFWGLGGGIVALIVFGAMVRICCFRNGYYQYQGWGGYWDSWGWGSRRNNVTVVNNNTTAYAPVAGQQPVYRAPPQQQQYQPAYQAQPQYQRQPQYQPQYQQKPQQYQPAYQQAPPQYSQNPPPASAPGYN